MIIEVGLGMFLLGVSITTIFFVLLGVKQIKKEQKKWKY